MSEAGRDDVIAGLTKADMANRLFVSADALAGRYLEARNRDDLDLSIAYTVEGLDLVPSDAAVRLPQLTRLAHRYAVRYVNHDTAGDFEVARYMLETAYRCEDLDAPTIRTIHLQLAMLYDTRHLRTSDPGDLDTAVATLAEEWHLWPDVEPGLIYARRLMIRGGAADVDIALAVVTRILAVDALSGALRGRADRIASSAYWQRYVVGSVRPTESPDHRDCLRHASAVIGNPDADPGDRRWARITRAIAAIQFGEREGRAPDDIGTIVADLEDLYATASDGDRTRIGVFLALTMSINAPRTLQRADIVRAIAMVEEVLSRSDTAPDLRPNLTVVLGYLLIAKVEAGLGGAADFDRADAAFRTVQEGSSTVPALMVTAASGAAMVLSSRVAYGYGDKADLDHAIDVLTSALDGTRAFPHVRAGLIPGLVQMLVRRYMTRGDLAALRRGLDLMRDVRSYARENDLQDIGVEVVYSLLLIKWREATGSGSTEEIIAELEGYLARTPVGHGYRVRVLNGLNQAWWLLWQETKDDAALDTTLRYAEQAVEECDPAGDLAITVVGTAASVFVAAGLARADVPMLRRAARLYVDRIGDPNFEKPGALVSLTARGAALAGISGLTRDLDDIRTAIEAMTWAFDRLPVLSIGMAEMAIMLGTVYGLAGDSRRAREIGDAALRGRAWHVLTQSSTEDATASVRQGATIALMIAQWCLRDGDPLAAWQALETGRGLVLHAATVTATIPELLDAAGRDDLAREWRTATQDTPFDARWIADDWRLGTPELPTDVRRAAVSALLDEQVLFEPPTPDAVCEALRAVAADMLVYLFPGDDEDPGLALLFDAYGRIEAIDLPDLTARWTTPVGLVRLGALRSAYPGERDLDPARTGPAREGLEQMCRAAWTAVMGPLLDHWHGLSTGREPRLILVPAGALAMVPWHAAFGVDDGGRRRWAIDEAEISYIASARLLVEVSRRRRPVGPRRADAM
jgi:hypothetical protein